MKKRNRGTVLVLEIDRSIVIVDEMTELVGKRKFLPLLGVGLFNENDPAAVVGIQESGECLVPVQRCGFERQLQTAQHGSNLVDIQLWKRMNRNSKRFPNQGAQRFEGKGIDKGVTVLFETMLTNPIDHFLRDPMSLLVSHGLFLS